MAKKSAAQKAWEKRRARQTDRRDAAATAAGQTAPAPSAPAAPPAPPPPPRVDPFFTADDLNALNAFSTDLATKLQGIDFNLQNLETDTTYQKTRTERDAKQASSAATDDAISRGIFSSSVKDANLYDIEAARSLSVKFLDDKLTTARLDAGTNKTILGSAKEGFDTAMAAKKVENAQGVNDANSSAWAAAMAAWQSANPTASTPTGPAPAGPTFKPSTADKPTGPLKGNPAPDRGHISPTQSGATPQAARRAAGRFAKKKQKIYG